MDVKQLFAAAEAGDAEAQFALADGYVQGAITTAPRSGFFARVFGGKLSRGEQLEHAATWLKRAAEQDHARATTSLALAYLLGDGVEQDAARARALLDQAFALGDAEARCHLGHLFRDGEALEQDLARARTCYQESLDAGGVQAHGALALLYLDGEGGPPDGAKALEHLELAVGADDLGAVFNLGRLLGDPEVVGEQPAGVSVDPDPERAVELLKRVALEARNAEAAVYAGAHLYAGAGVPKDLEDALQLFMLAMQLGHPEGAYHVGVMQINGEGTPQAPEAGLSLVVAAAQAGVPEAVAMLEPARTGSDEQDAAEPGAGGDDAVEWTRWNAETDATQAPEGRFRVVAYHVDWDTPRAYVDVDTLAEATRICDALKDVCQLNVDFAWAHDDTGKGVHRGPW